VADVLIPVLNVNDEQYVLTELLVPDGAQVQAGDAVAVVESSKAASELVCVETGVLRWVANVMTRCRPGQPVARIVAPGSPAPDSGQPDPVGAEDHSGITITNAARELMGERGVSAVQVAGSGKKLIRVADVEAILEQGSAATENGGTLPLHQLAVARTVSRSHATIPGAFLAIKVEAPWVAVPDTSGQHTVVTPSLTELVISSVAAMARPFPIMFARVAEDLTLTSPESIDVGVTIDLGKGLTVPAIRAADNKSVGDIRSTLMSLRVKAMRSKLTDEDLCKPCVVIALQQETGVVLSIPIVYPGNVCALSIGALVWEVAFGHGGELVPRAYFLLGISYDHRVVNGRNAALFMSAVRDHLTGIAAEARRS
jgi:2-oxoglutarate dehydrogenase E2 component (dihydrolipoamide succinyltransferase)